MILVVEWLRHRVAIYRMTSKIKYVGGMFLKKITSLLLLLVIIFAFIVTYPNNQKQLIYDLENSRHGDFTVNEGYVIVRDYIEVENTTSDDLYFSMYADMSIDQGLVTDKIVPACKEGMLTKEIFFIKAKSKQQFVVYFKSVKGPKDTKADRLPPQNVIFEIQK